ncbi:dihydroorotase [Caproiciproducens sp. NJN-50]|uniref:dihydroorotase n=1 Tax=Caproiciproducens sp. NJN-50 TaxID=2507162 RepID=UPI000FFE0841|nr:dihydroorotase [Caproiciproducens sp. NJN-50]QAT50817.1 dihydroorotase [Caproiciproducens sp. NJN-50]
MEKLLLRGARILDPSHGTDETGDLLVCDGQIERIGGAVACEDARVIDASGLVAAPGLIDLHVHLRDPGFTEKEDVLSGCRAAAAGGVTSLLCMPNTRPALDNAETVSSLLQRTEGADARVYAAGAITKGLSGAEPTDLRKLRETGARAVSDDGRPVADSALMARAMQGAAELGLFVTSHCEDLSLAAGGKLNEGEVSRALGVPGIPAAAEDCGTARELSLAEAYRLPVHICHVSTKTSVGMIRDAKRRGVPVTCETAPHYFALTERELLRRDADYRMNPPLRAEEDRAAVAEGLRDGTIDVIATDHAPHTPEEKTDFLTAPSGVIGMETSLAAGITFLVLPGILTLAQLIGLMSCTPARLLGVPGGTLAPGSPADLVLFDPNETWTVEPAKLHGKSRNAVFKGMKLTGRVRMTLLGGKIVYQQEE